MKFQRVLFALLLLLTSLTAHSQLFRDKEKFTRADSLRGNLTILRTCYDVNYYHLDIKIDIKERSVSGSNLFRFTAMQNFRRLQFDLFENLKIDKIIYRDKEIPFTREYNAVFIEFPQMIYKGDHDEFNVFYSGKPANATRPPWDAGFIFSETPSEKDWVAVACQGTGASVWWPNKDHQSDEADSMLISISVPKGVMNVSNGRLRSIKAFDDGYTQYNWFVSYPINNYNATVNITDYAHFEDIYNGENGKLTLDYYVLPENLGTAKTHFKANVKPVLKCFEYWFGPYPFYKDGYKLVETPYLGMEHQSAIAYGNKYKQGYLGNDRSSTGLGLKWDFIIVHETAHEWFGNNITSKDLADMWIHEAFATYAESLYTESLDGKGAGMNYIKGLRKTILNDEPVTGPYDVNKEGSGDMYSKGANLLHTIRIIINDDAKWRNILRGLNKDFGLKTVTAQQVVNYINMKSGKNFSSIFDQYLHYTQLPVLEIKKEKNNTIAYRWKAEAENFNMPLRIKLAENDQWKFITPSKSWRTVSLKDKTGSLIVDTDNFYIKTDNL